MPLSRRWPILALICALLGVLTTFALAWGCAVLMNPDRAAADFRHSPRADGSADVIVIQRVFGHSRINRAQCAELRLDPDSGEILMARWSSLGQQSSETRAGWPLRALGCVNLSDVTITAGSSAMQVQSSPSPPIDGGWGLPAFAGGRLGGTWRAIPLQPIWSGLLADIAILSAAWFALIAGSQAIVRRRRRERGCCPSCGYDLRSGGLMHERCPECGMPVPLPGNQHASDARQAAEP